MFEGFELAMIDMGGHPNRLRRLSRRGSARACRAELADFFAA